MEGLAQRNCTHHPDRPGFALCMNCRKAVCQACATTWDGINYCRPCLAKRRVAREADPRWRLVADRAGMVAALMVACFCVVRFMVWALALMAAW